MGLFLAGFALIGAVFATFCYLLLLKTYIAAPDEPGAIAIFRRLLEKGYGVISDQLGEFVRTEEDADLAASEYSGNAANLGPLADAHPGRVAIAVKPTAIGLGLDAAAAHRRAERICEAAAAKGVFVWFDAEHKAAREPTLEMVTKLSIGRWNVGLAVQAMHRNAPETVAALAAACIHVRLVKGAYGDGDIMDPAALAKSLRELIAEAHRQHGDSGFVATGTCDDSVLDAADPGMERQFLWGVRPALAARLLAEGRRVTLYCPFGSLARSHGYFARRLKEGVRWSALWLFARNIFEARAFRKCLREKT